MSVVFTDLPADVLCMIASHSDDATVGRLHAVCRALRAVLLDDGQYAVWRPRVRALVSAAEFAVHDADGGDDGVLEAGASTDWRKLYREAVGGGRFLREPPSHMRSLPAMNYGSINAIAASGESVVYVTDGSAVVHVRVDGGPDLPEVCGHGHVKHGRLMAVCVDVAGGRVASGAYNTHGVDVFDLESLTPISNHPISSSVRSSAFTAPNMVVVGTESEGLGFLDIRAPVPVSFVQHSGVSGCISSLVVHDDVLYGCTWGHTLFSLDPRMHRTTLSAVDAGGQMYALSVPSHQRFALAGFAGGDLSTFTIVRGMFQKDAVCTVDVGGSVEGVWLHPSGRSALAVNYDQTVSGVDMTAKKRVWHASPSLGMMWAAAVTRNTLLGGTESGALICQPF